MEEKFISSVCRNISISGRVASGATTLSRSLAQALHWKLINGGELVRVYCKENGIPLEETAKTTDEFHLKLDELIKQKLRDINSLIIESWLAGFDAQEINGVFKILVVCSDESVRIDRLVNRENITIEEAKMHIKKREDENLKKWKKLYHIENLWDPKIYNLLIDTYHNGPTETLQIALQAVGFSDFY